MTDDRPKLLVLGGPHVDADAVEVALSTVFEVIESSAEEAVETLESRGCHAVLAEAGDFLPLERDLVGRQSAMLLNAIGEGVCLADVHGRVLWSNAMFQGFTEGVRKRVSAACVEGAAWFERRGRSAGGRGSSVPESATGNGSGDAADEPAGGQPGIGLGNGVGNGGGNGGADAGMETEGSGGGTGGESGGGSGGGVGGRLAGQPMRTKRYNLAFPKSARYFEVLVSPICRASPLGVTVEGAAGVAEAVSPADVGARGVEVVMVAAVVRDVTAAKRTQSKIDAIDRAGRELSRLDAETIRKLHASDRLRVLEDKVVQYATELLRFDHFAVRMVHPSTRSLELVMSKGLPSEARNIELKASEEGEGISGRVAATGRSYVCRNTKEDPLYVFGLNEPGSSLTVPLRVHDEVVGVFNVESSEPDAFTESDRQFAEIFASYIASALHTLNLLVVERQTTSRTATGTVSGEISGPLNDLMAEVEILMDRAGGDEEARRHLERIKRDVKSIRKRMKSVASGSQTLLGADEVLETGGIDPALQGKRVLIADNEEGIRNTIRDVLTRVGCAVVTCDDGTSAIRLLDTWRVTHDSDEAFDIVLSDINLGDTTGYQVFEAAKRAERAMPVILMTGFGYDPHHSIVRATQEGLHSVLFKPFQAEKLIEDVKSAVGAGGG